MHNQYWSSISGRTYLNITVAGRKGRSLSTESEGAIDTALTLIRSAGLDPRHLCRSRLWARDVEARQTASDIRRDKLTGELRAASSSFITPWRLPDDASMMIDLTVLVVQDASAPKSIREYAPPITPPMYVSLDGMVFLSGHTNTEPGLTTQITNIRRNIEGFMQTAGTSWDRAVEVSIFLAESEANDTGRRAMLAGLPALACPLSITVVGGFSALEKRIEIEVSATLA